MDCPSWRQDGYQAGGQVLGVHGPGTPEPSTAGSVLCVGSAASAQRNWGFPFHITGICTFLTAPQHTAPWPPAAARARRASARSFWNVGECSGTGILFSTSEPHGMPWWSWPSGPVPDTLRPPSCCMCHHHSERQVPRGCRPPGLSAALGPCSSLSRPRNLQTHVQIFHRSDVRAQTFQHGVPVLPL